ncbi:MAG: hypothetical protein HY363_03295 [Candidatus Aenigmarchaeota archaeon]|nr:hypothetical protein [Candidatus Aenigmarchaeota archaeon]
MKIKARLSDVLKQVKSQVKFLVPDAIINFPISTSPEQRKSLTPEWASEVDTLIENQVRWTHDNVHVSLENIIFDKQKIFFYDAPEWTKLVTRLNLRSDVKGINNNFPEEIYILNTGNMNETRGILNHELIHSFSFNQYNIHISNKAIDKNDKTSIIDINITRIKDGLMYCNAFTGLNEAVTELLNYDLLLNCQKQKECNLFRGYWVGHYAGVILLDTLLETIARQKRCDAFALRKVLYHSYYTGKRSGLITVFGDNMRKLSQLNNMAPFEKHNLKIAQAYGIKKEYCEKIEHYLANYDITILGSLVKF